MAKALPKRPNAWTWIFLSSRHIFIYSFPLNKISRLLPVPHTGDLGMPHLLLQLEDTEHECLGGGRAARDVDIHRHDAVASSGHTVAVVVVAATVGAATHGNDPSGVGHLIVDLAERRCHLVGESSGDNHDVGLARRGTENDTHAILIVTGSGQVHHFDGAAGETEGHGPKRALTCPVCDLVKSSAGHHVRTNIFLPMCSNCSKTYSAYCMTPCLPSWLGNGTSRCGFPVIAFMGGGVPGAPLTRPGVWLTGAAGFVLEEEMKAALATRKGWRAAVGLAIAVVSFLVAVVVVVEWRGEATYRAAPWPSLVLV